MASSLLRAFLRLSRGREVTCGGGMQVRRWTIAVPAMHGGKACPSLIETKICAKEKCPFDCQYSNWGSRSACDQTCNVPGGRQGMSYTRRTVVKKANKGVSGKAATKRVTKPYWITISA